MENNVKYGQAIKLMEEALKKYDEGDVKSALTMRDEANTLFEGIDKEIRKTIKDDTLLYGPNRNFGIIYHIFEANMDYLLSTKEGREIIKEFTKKIKGNKVLTEEFNIYESLCTNGDVGAAEFYVNEAVAVFPSFSKSDLVNLHNELLGILREGKIDEVIEIDENRLALYEAIEYLMLNKASLSNVKEVAANKQVIKEHLDSNKDKGEEKPSYNMQMESVVNKYGDELNEDEMKLVKEFISSENKEKLFNTYKEQTISKINATRNLDEDKDRWDDVYKTVCEKKYDENTALYEISQMVEIQNILD